MRNGYRAIGRPGLTGLLPQLLPQGWQLPVLLAGLTLMLCGCTGVPLEMQAPPGFDLTGEWRLVAEQGTPPRDQDGYSSGFLVQDFPLLVARQLRIEQDTSSMGVEYSGGRYRDVSWGERRRGLWEVNAGWHEGNLHIFSRASDASATEVYRLEDGGERLVIEIDVKMVGGRNLSFARIFERQSAI